MSSPLAPDEVYLAVMASSINFNTVWTSIFEPLPTFGFLDRLGRESEWAERHALPYHIVGSDASGVVQKLAEGWAVNGITMYQSGQPLNIRLASSQLNTGTDNFANVTCSEIGTPKQVTQWFDTSCFATPPNFQFGNYEIGQVRGPNFVNTDFSVFKRTAFAGTRSVEFRVETFNLFNKAHFSNPNDRFGNANFGRISSTRFPSREIQLGARFLF